MQEREPPQRWVAAVVDLIVWWMIVMGVLLAAEGVSQVMQVSRPGVDQLDPLFQAFVAVSVFCANLYLGISALIGRSVGKALFGLRLTGANGTGRPGLEAGMLRSAAQAIPLGGALLVLAGSHDRLAGTRIVAKERGVSLEDNDAAPSSSLGPAVNIGSLVLATVAYSISAGFWVVVFTAFGAI